MTSPASPDGQPADPSATPPGAASDVDPTTRLVLARLASGASRLAADETSAPTPRTGGMPSRMEAAALAAALVAATFIGAAMPGSPDARAQSAPQTVFAAAPAPAPTAVAAATPASAATDSTSSTGAATDTASDGASDPVATPAAAETPAANDTTTDSNSSSDTDTAGDEGDGSDPLAGGTDRLDQVALVIVHGDAPARWATAADGTPARARAKNGTTLTGVAVTPGAPLGTSLGLIAGQATNSLTRAGCSDPAASPLTPGTVDDLGRVAGTGCDYPSGTPSLPSAVAIDGRRWKAYAPVPADAAAGALCGTGTPTGPAAAFSATSALRRLGDLASSGACDGAAAPLSALAGDLAADEPPAWLVVEVGACGLTGCDADADATRDQDLDAALATLTGSKGLGKSSAVIVVGDGTASGLEPAPAGSLPTTPDDPDAPAAVLGGALLLGPGVAAGTTDPLPLDPFALARTQADWLGLDAPGWAKADGVSGLAVPAG